MTSIYYCNRGGRLSADVHQNCRICDSRCHVIFNGKKNVEAVQLYLTGIREVQHTQDLPFEQPIREFLFSGMCRECQDKYMGVTSKKIKYCRNERM